MWEFPATSQTRIEYWKEPQYDKNIVWWIALFTGFFGFHHLYLRSPQTTLIFIIMNFLTFGYWYFFDLIQLSQSSEILNKEGLQMPLGFAGIAQGMFFPDEQDAEARPKSNLPNPLWFVLYTLLIPVAPIASLVAGDNGSAFSRLLTFFLFPIGLLMNFLYTLHDYFILLMKPSQLFQIGVTRFFPWTFIGFRKTGYSPRLVRDVLPETCPSTDNFFISTTKFFIQIILPFVKVAFPGLALQLENVISAAEKAQAVVATAKNTAVQGLAVASKAKNIITQVPSAAASLAQMNVSPDGLLKKAQQQGMVPPMPSAPLIPSAPSSSAPSAPPAPEENEDPSPLIQRGGGMSKEDKTPLDFVGAGAIAALIGGGLLLSIGRTFLQNDGENESLHNDTPPNPRTV